MGTKVKPMNLNVRKYLNAPFDNGVVIVDIEKKSTAMLAGLKIGDIILKVDGTLVNSNEDINAVNRQNFRKVGDQIELEVWRNHKILSIPLELKNYY
jgi:S1-C subfamily serine protease